MLTRDLDAVLGIPAEDVIATRGVAELLGEVRKHRLDSARVCPRGGGVVHVNRELQSHSGGPVGEGAEN